MRFRNLLTRYIIACFITRSGPYNQPVVAKGMDGIKRWIARVRHIHWECAVHCILSLIRRVRIALCVEEAHTIINHACGCTPRIVNNTGLNFELRIPAVEEGRKVARKHSLLEQLRSFCIVLIVSVIKNKWVQRLLRVVGSNYYILSKSAYMRQWSRQISIVPINQSQISIVPITFWIEWTKIACNL